MAQKSAGAMPRRSVECTLELKDARQRLGVSLEDIAERTKISIRFLRAIEAEEFEKLPGGIFTTSYLRQYAAAVGVEEGYVLTYYQRKTNPAEPPAARASEHSIVKETLVRFLRASVAAGR